MANDPEYPPVEPPRRKREPWSFKSLVQDVSGRPITDFQEPPPAGRTPAPGRLSARPADSDVPLPVNSIDPVEVRADVAEADLGLDPVARIFPPLSGATGRRLHGADAEHHAETLRSVESPEELAGLRRRTHQPGPSRRPERIYLHYLLLHLDRLHDPALRYLKQAVDEEIAQREAPPPPVSVATEEPPGVEGAAPEVPPAAASAEPAEVPSIVPASAPPESPSGPPIAPPAV